MKENYNARVKLSNFTKLQISAFTVTFLFTQCSPQNLVQTSGRGALEQKAASPHVTKIRTYDSPGRSSEIISYSNPLGLLLATNSVSKEIVCMRLPNPATASPQPISFGSNQTGIQLDGEPTSVACHPSQAYAFTAVNSDQGRLVIFDLKAAAQGQKKVILDQPIGIQLDSIAVSPNGQWVVVADEAEGSASTPGNILIASTQGFNSGKKLNFKKVPGLAEALGRPGGRVEPEFIAIDASSRFAAVSCQEDNAVAIVRLSNSPSLGSIIPLPSGSEPDGVHMIYHAGRTILGIAEEGTDSVSFYQINSGSLQAALLSRVNIRTLGGQGLRSDPEGVALFKQGGNLYAAISVERANRVTILNLNNPSAPVKEAVVPVGSRPEGIIAVRKGSSTTVISADEGKPGRGEISFIKIK